MIRWNTESDVLEHGSWFHGRLYPKRSDVSFDGHWMIYLAMGASGDTWSGVCRLPYLRTILEGGGCGTWYGGGYWCDRETLVLNGWPPWKGTVPFTVKTLLIDTEDLGVLYSKWVRDGWRRRGDNYGVQRRITNAAQYTVKCIGDDGWENKPTPKHPALIARYLGYMPQGHTFRFALDGYADLLDHRVDSACWDSRGNLVYSRLGILYKYSLDDLKKGHPGSILDLEPLTANKA